MTVTAGPTTHLTTSASEAPVRRLVAHVMGMPISLALRAPGLDVLAAGPVAEADAAWAEVLASLREADEVFSTYRPASWISRLGRGEIALGDCPPEVEQVLALAEVARVESGGAFDVRRPSGGGTLLDPAGIVKGWAVQRASAPLREHADREGVDFCLSAGGDLVAHVARPDHPSWQIGIEDPHHPTRLIARIPVARGAVATSALTHRGPHIVDPRTGSGAAPVVPTELASVTVVTEDLTTADVDATAAFVLGERGLAWLRQRGRSGLVVRADGTCEVLAG